MHGFADDAGRPHHRHAAQYAARSAGALAPVAADFFPGRPALVYAAGAAGRYLQWRIYTHRSGCGCRLARAGASGAGISRLKLAQLLGRGAGVHAQQRSDYPDTGWLLHPELCLHGGRRAPGDGAWGRRHATVVPAVLALRQPIVFSAGLFFRRIRVVAGVCAHAAAGGQLVGYRPGALWRAGRAQYDDRPDSSPLWHAAVCHQSAHWHTD